MSIPSQTPSPKIILYLLAGSLLLHVVMIQICTFIKNTCLELTGMGHRQYI